MEEQLSSNQLSLMNKIKQNNQMYEFVAPIQLLHDIEIKHFKNQLIIFAPDKINYSEDRNLINTKFHKTLR